MGVISIEKADCLFWLGRYTERVFTTVKVFFEYFDKMIDGSEFEYKKYCEKLAIPDIYKDKKDFAQRYVFDKDNENSIIVSMNRACDNALISRDDISTEAMSYLEMSLKAIMRAKDSDAPLFELQTVIDDIYAFWGSIDDYVVDEECRNIIKCGRHIERMDLYLRLDICEELLYKEFAKLSKRIEKVNIGYRINCYDKLSTLMKANKISNDLRKEILTVVQDVFI